MPPKSFEVSKPQPDAPQLSKSPLESLTPNPYYEPSLLAKYGLTGLGALGGCSGVAIGNIFQKRPVYSKILYYPLFAAIGATLLYSLQKYKENQWAERDAIFRHYISLHPEDFPPYERVKFGDLFQDWTPIR